MVCVGSTRILVHKAVISAASQTLHELALEFDMTPHRERDQLEIIIPPDVNLFAVNMFINFLYTGQVQLNSRIINHLERLASLFSVTRLQMICQEYIQKNAPPDSQNLNLRPENQIEPDSSINGAQPGSREERVPSTPDDTSQSSNLSRSNSVCSGISADQGVSFGSVSIKTEPAHLASYETEATRRHVLPGLTRGQSDSGSSSLAASRRARNQSSQSESSMSALEKLMCPVVNLKKLPSNITPSTVVMVSDDENEGESTETQTTTKKMPAQYSLEEKEAIALEAKRYGTTQVSRSKNIPLPDLLSWMTLFGLRNPGTLRLKKLGAKVNHEADLALVRWIVQQQEMNGFVDLNSMKQYALTVHQQTNPKFCASKTWLGNFLQRNMSVLQGTKFVHGDKDNEMDIHGNTEMSAVAVKKEMLDDDDEDQAQLGENVLETLGQNTVLENVPLNEQLLVNEAVAAGLKSAGNHSDGFESIDNLGNSRPASTLSGANLELDSKKPNIEMIETPLGKKPIIIGQSRTFDAKSERKIVQWALERVARDGYVFTDDFKDYARSLYKGTKVFGATQAWMKKFLRRHRALKNVKFCSKFKNVYTTDDKVNCVAMAKRYGVSYASKHSGINQKVIHCWKLAYDKGMLNVDQEALLKIEALSSSIPAQSFSSVSDVPSTSSISPGSAQFSHGVLDQAVRGIVPEFEQRIVQDILDLQTREGSVNYSDISRISQAIYKETRPNFKASYNWIKTFLDRHKEELAGIELENVSKVLVENDTSVPGLEGSHSGQLNDPKITEMVNQALQVLQTGDSFTNNSTAAAVATSATSTTVEKRPVIIGPSVVFDRKTEKTLVDWALERQQQEGYVFTDDFKLFAKSVYSGPKNFSASSGWMTLFLRRHPALKNILWRSKFKSNYTEEEKQAAVAEAKRLGAGPVGKKLGIQPKLICAWRIKMERDAPKQQTFWKGTKIRKFGRGLKPALPKFCAVRHTALSLGGSDAARGIVPEFEQRIVSQIIEEHKKEGSISYEEMSRIAQSVYKETRPTFKASYAWIRNFMKRNEGSLPQDLNIENVKKVLYPDEEVGDDSAWSAHSAAGDVDPRLEAIFRKRPIIVGQSRSLDTKTEKKLVQWTVEQQEKNGYVFLDQFKAFAQSLYKGEKKFAATQAWRIKFLRRNHAALKHVKFQSSFRNQYTLEEKKAILEEARKYGVGHVARKTGIDHCLINAWRIKLERSGDLPPDTPELAASTNIPYVSERPNFVSKVKEHVKEQFGPGLFSVRGIVPAFEKKIVSMIMRKMDEEGSVTYQDVSNCARAVYRETRPQFKASYNWIKDFIKRNKKDLKEVKFETCKKLLNSSEADTEVIIADGDLGNIEDFMSTFEDSGTQNSSATRSRVESVSSLGSSSGMDIEIDNPEDPNYDLQSPNEQPLSSGAADKPVGSGIEQIIAKRPIIIGKAVHFDRKTEKKIVDWLLETQGREGFVFTDDFRRYARSLYTGPPEKFGATNAWITKFLRRNRLQGKIEFQSKLKGNNAKFEEKICELILEQQETDGSVSYEDIQKITQSVYKETRPNFRACYGWIKDFLKRNQEKLAGVDLENVKKVFIPDENEKDGILIQNFDHTKTLACLDTSASSYFGHADERSNMSFSDNQSLENSWFDLDSSVDLDASRSQGSVSPRSVLEKMASQKRPVIVGPPRGMDSKTEKKLVKWMQEQQEEDGCVYLDLFKEYAKSVHSGPKKFAATQAWMTKFKQRNADALKNVIIRSRFRNEYSVEEKLAIVEEAKRLGCNHVGRKLGINGGVIYSWKVQLEQMERVQTGTVSSAPLDSSQMSSTRGVVPEFENRILEMVLETNRAKGSVTYEDISLCARTIYKETRPNFKASNNWVLDFIRKFKEELKNVKIENQKKVYTEEEKLHILSEEKKYGTEHVVKKRNISSSTLYTWKRSMVAKSIPIPKYKAVVSSKIKKKYARGKNVKTYTLEEKRNMVAVAEAKGVTYAALKLGVTRTMLGKWIRYFRDQGENIVINYTHSSTLKKELEQRVVAWVLEEHKKLGIVLTNRIINHAKKVFEEAYTGFNATQNWLEGFLMQNAEKFEKVRFRDEGDKDLEFSDEIKLKVSRYAEKHGANETSDLTGIRPKLIYHWRRAMKQKGFDLAEEPPAPAAALEKVELAEPKSLMQQKLDRIAAKFSTEEKIAVVQEASVSGTSVIASKYKVPLPLLLKWMKQHLEGQGQEGDSGSMKEGDFKTGASADTKLKIKLPSIEKQASSTRYSKEFKKQVMEEVREVGVPKVCEKYNLKSSTVYYWVKEERGSSAESSRDSVEKSVSGLRSSQGHGSAAPVLVEDIKKEPGISDTVKTPRGKYTEEQKIQAAKIASEIGYKQASILLGIPKTNIQRWQGLFGHLTSPPARQSPATQFASDTRKPSTSLDSLKGGNIDRKRKVSETAVSPFGSKRYKQYTDEEKIAFVKESEVNGTSATAAKAGVSLDLMYRWRSMYRNAARQKGEDVLAENQSLQSASEDVGNSAEESQFEGRSQLAEDLGSPQMPAPRNKMYDLATKTASLMKSGSVKSKGGHLAYLGMPVGSGTDSPGKDEDSDIDISIDLVRKIDEHVSVDHGTEFDSFSSERKSRGEKSSSDDVILLSDEVSNSPNVHALDEIDSIVADQMLEMTSSYMEAEEKHEKDPLGIQTGSGKLTEGDNDEKFEMHASRQSELIQDICPSKMVVDTQNLKLPKQSSSSRDVKLDTDKEKSEKSEEGGVSMIQITDVKSEAESY